MPINLLMTAAFLIFLSSCFDKVRSIIGGFCNLETCTCSADSHMPKEKEKGRVNVAIAVESKCYSSSSYYFNMEVRK